MPEKEQTILRSIAIAVGVVLISVIAALVVSSIFDSSVFDDIAITGTNTDETLSAVDNVTNSTLAIKSAHSDASCTLSTLTNATGGETVASGNYTFYSSACNLILVTASSYIGEDLNATYDYSYSSGANSAGVNVTAVSALFGEFVVGLLGFLGVIGIVIGVVWLIIYVARLFGRGGLNDLGNAA